ncbi:MAG: BatA domain-containing protein [Gemmatimonadota bacterium]
MTFLAPWALWAAGVVSAAVIALHILASKNPRVTPLPTARFIPDVPLRATARAMRLSDVLLMLLRVAVVMLVGVAFARPEMTTGKRPVGRVVMVDRYPAESDRAAADSAQKYFRDGDLAFAYDSAVHRLPGKAPFANVSAASVESGSGGSLSAALAGAMRAASTLRGSADSVEIVIVSTFNTSEFDAATSAIRAVWRGRIRVVRVSRDSLPNDAQVITNVDARANRDVRGSPPDDPLRASIAFVENTGGRRAGTDSVRMERGSLSGIDTSWTQHGGTLVRWPAALDSSGFPAHARADTAGAVVAGSGSSRAVVVAPFVRVVDPPAGRVVARWADGSPAATERTVKEGCVRDVAIPLPRAGDLVLRESARRLVAALSSPCGARAITAPATDSALDQLRDTGPLVATRALQARTDSSSTFTTWMLVAAFVLLLVEPLLRRQRAAA